MPWVTVRQSTSILRYLFSKNTAYLASWVLISLAAAGPRLTTDLPSLSPTNHSDIMLVVDVSRSMNVTDTQPSRLQRARIEIEEFLMRANGSRIGIIVFAARAHLFVPLTFDHRVIQHYLRYIDDLILPTHGSDPIAAIKMAQKELKDSTQPPAIIILSDGDFYEMAEKERPSDFLPDNIQVYGLGIGTKEGGGIPLANGEWLKHEGIPVISRLNEKNMEDLVKNKNKPHNNYISATKGGRDWEMIYDQGILRVSPTKKQASKDTTAWDELFIWPLFPALILLWVSLSPFGLNIPRSSINRKKTNSPSINGILIAFLSIATITIVFPKMSAADGLDIENKIDIFHAFKKYNNADYASALDLYQNITGYSARLGEGSCNYKLKNYSGAIQQYSQSVMLANNDKERATALFNLGNAYFQTGNYKVASSIYHDASLYNPAQKNIQHNLQFSRELKKSVDQRASKRFAESHPGSGPQMGPSQESLNNNQTGSMAVDQSINRKIEDLPLPEIDNISASALEILIQKGLQRVHLAAKNNSHDNGMNASRQKLSTLTARLMMSKLEDQQTTLWKRLFEIEEGFPAPLSSPRNVPGLPAW